MDDPPVVSRDEWLAARRELLAQEKEFTRQRDALNTKRRKLPMAGIDKEYNLPGPGRPGQPARPVRGPRPAADLPLHVRPGLGRGLRIHAEALCEREQFRKPLPVLGNPTPGSLRAVPGRPTTAHNVGVQAAPVLAINRSADSSIAVPCSMVSTPARTSSETASVVTWAATRPPAARTAATMALIASPEYVSSGAPDGIPSVTGGKSAITFTHRPPCASSPTASSVNCSRGAASGSNTGEYRPAGARNRPAACNRGMPGTRSRCNADPPADPVSRTRHTPQAAHPPARSAPRIHPEPPAFPLPAPQRDGHGHLPNRARRTGLEAAQLRGPAQ